MSGDILSPRTGESKRLSFIARVALVGALLGLTVGCTRPDFGKGNVVRQPQTSSESKPVPHFITDTGDK